MHRFFNGQFFNFEAVRILGMTGYGGADVAECLEAIGRIDDNDAESWERAWLEQAKRVEGLAAEAEQLGHKVAARDAYFRASNYYRASVYMRTGEVLGQSNSGVIPALRKSTELFRFATQLLPGQVQRLEIPPCEPGDMPLPAYLYLPPQSCRVLGKIPVLISLIGADSTQEEIYYMFPAAGPQLGYAVLTFEGPGQGLTLHEKGVPMRADWETVIRTVFDHLEKFSVAHGELDLDLGRVAIAGASLGAYFALRGATDSRCKACIAVDPVYDLWDFAAKHVAPKFFAMWEAGWIPDAVVNCLIGLSMRLSFQTRWEIRTSARFLGVSSPVGIIGAMKKFTLQQNDSSSYLDQVECPVMVTGAAQSLYFNVNDHSNRVYRDLGTHDKELWVGQTPGEGGLQAKMGAMALCNQRAFAFLDEKLAVERSRIA